MINSLPIILPFLNSMSIFFFLCDLLLVPLYWLSLFSIFQLVFLLTLFDLIQDPVFGRPDSLLVHAFELVIREVHRLFLRYPPFDFYLHLVC